MTGFLAWAVAVSGSFSSSADTLLLPCSLAKRLRRNDQPAPLLPPALLWLMPCAWCYLAVIICLTIRMHPKPFTWLDILGCIFFFRNFLDPVGTHAITGHFWSLSIEEQFYLVWPSVLLLGRRSALWLAIGSSCLVVAWRSPLFSANHHALLTATQYRADALLVGCAMGLMIPTLRPYLRSWMALPLLVFLAASIYQSLAFIPLHESIAVALLLGVTTSCPGLPVLNWKPLVSTRDHLVQCLCMAAATLAISERRSHRGIFCLLFNSCRDLDSQLFPYRGTDKKNRSPGIRTNCCTRQARFLHKGSKHSTSRSCLKHHMPLCPATPADRVHPGRRKRDDCPVQNRRRRD